MLASSPPAAREADEDDDAPPVVEVLRPEGRAPFVLVCEHASNFIPRCYAGLGLSPSELERHIAYDIGAAGITRRLSELLDAPAYLSGRSRLLIDANRPPGSPTSVPEVSEATVVPGNRDLTEAERQERVDRYFTPFHGRLAEDLDRREKGGERFRIVAVHSFTPVYLGVARPYHAGILFRGPVEKWGQRLVALLDRPDRPVVANAPYEIEDASDYLVPRQAEPRGLEALLLEIRQDLVATPSGQEAWAETIAEALATTTG
jgi:predicted N-formylglutamate amidohydrolase